MADTSAGARRARILLITTADSSYPGADTVGQMHLAYAANTYVLRVPDPVMLPESFYLHCLRAGIDGILVMSSGAEGPFSGTYEKLARRLDRLGQSLKARGVDFRRIRLSAICTVCTASFLKEIKMMNALLDDIGPVRPETVPLAL